MVITRFQAGEGLHYYSEGHTLLTPGAEKKILSQFLREEERRCDFKSRQ